MTNNNSPTKELIARITHDLASPVGALSNALEFMFDIENIEVDPSTKELLEGSIEKLSTYLQLLRIALGKSYDPTAVPPAKIMELIKKFYSHSQLSFSFEEKLLQELSPKKVPLLLLFLLIIPKLIRPKSDILLTLNEKEQLSIQLLGTFLPKGKELFSLLQKAIITPLNADTIFLFYCIELQKQLNITPSYIQKSDRECIIQL